MGSKPSYTSAVPILEPSDLEEIDVDLADFQDSLSVALEAERVYQHLTDRLYKLTMVKELGRPSIELATRATIFLLLRNPQVELRVSKTAPYISISEDSLSLELADLWTAWNSLVESMPHIQKDLAQVKDRVFEYNAQANRRLAVARDYIHHKRLKAADAVLLLKVVYCNNDIGFSARDALKSIGKKTERAIAGFGTLSTSFTEEYLGELGALVRAIPPTNQKGFLKKCRDLPGGLDQTVLVNED